MAKIIQIGEQEWIRQAKKGDRVAQKKIYDKYAALMLSHCRWYIHDLQFAEDVMIKGFFSAFCKLHQLKEGTNLRAWLRKIMTNECLDFLKSKVYKIQFEEWTFTQDSSYFEFDDFENVELLQRWIDSLPEGCKIVFNLYAIDGYSHKEIAKMLEISVGTSKSQLAYARKILKNKWIKNKKNV